MITLAIKQGTLEDIKKKGITLVDFYADWCGPCKQLAPTLDELSKEVEIVKIDVDKNPNDAGSMGVMSIPTLVLFKDGEPIDKLVGNKSLDELKIFVQK
jgi:thioredoxin 1